MAFSPNGKELARGGSDGARLMSVATHRQVGIMMSAGVFSAFGAAFIPDGKILATTQSQGPARLWKLS